jgi:hypothetical protein
MVALQHVKPEALLRRCLLKLGGLCQRQEILGMLSPYAFGTGRTCTRSLA